MTFDEIRALAAQHIHTNLDIAAAVAMAESAGNPMALNDSGRDLSYGLWQVNMIGALGEARRRQFGLWSNEDLFNPGVNARAMAVISSGGADWKPWGAFTNGSYLKFMPKEATVAKLAPALAQLRSQFNAGYPNRDKASDGWIGDARHSARTSDHNPDPDGTVDALDIDKDLYPGADAEFNAIVEQVANDPRLKYTIWRRRIKNPGQGWRSYSGSNPHDKHAHFSVREDRQNDARPWAVPGSSKPAPVSVQPSTGSRPYPGYGGRFGGYNRTEFQKKKDGNVQWIQERINAHSPASRRIAADGYFGAITEERVKQFQTAKRLKADGIVGPLTWSKLA